MPIRPENRARYPRDWKAISLRIRARAEGRCEGSPAFPECRAENGKAKFGHPTVKPEAVMDKIVRNVAGSTICDPFMGTGSTGVAAVKAGKAFVGIEQNPTHFETACQRIAAALENS